jgi:hypothetical protein
MVVGDVGSLVLHLKMNTMLEYIANAATRQKIFLLDFDMPFETSNRNRGTEPNRKTEHLGFPRRCLS